jgi:hypothetical protein
LGQINSWFISHESHQKHLICNIGHFEKKLYKINPKAQKPTVMESTSWNSTNSFIKLDSGSGMIKAIKQIGDQKISVLTF